MLGLAVQLAAASIVIPAGTSVNFTTVAPISSKTVIQGQRFPLTVSEDVTVDSHVVIPRGTAAVGEVDAVSGTGVFGKAGRLVLRPLFVDIAGERVNFVGISVDEGRDGTAAAAVTTALIGAFGLVITGKSATVPAGSPLYGRVRTDGTIHLASEKAQ